MGFEEEMVTLRSPRWTHMALPSSRAAGRLTGLHGNVVEISHNQGVYATVQEVWGATS